MCSAAQGNEMKIQKVFEAFEQFHLGEETLAQLVTQLEASLMQVNFWFSGIKGRRWWKGYLGIDGLGGLVSFLLKRAYIVFARKDLVVYLLARWTRRTCRASARRWPALTPSYLASCASTCPLPPSPRCFRQNFKLQSRPILRCFSRQRLALKGRIWSCLNLEIVETLEIAAYSICEDWDALLRLAVMNLCSCTYWLLNIFPLLWTIITWLQHLLQRR